MDFSLLPRALRYRNWPEILFDLAAKRTPRRFVFRDGTRFEVPGGFPWWFQLHEIWFDQVYFPVPLTITEHDVIVDIGAHVGIFTLFAASRTRGPIYAIEPDPANCARLSHHLRINHVRNVNICNVALADQCGTLALQVSAFSSTRNFLTLPTIQENVAHHAPARLADRKTTIDVETLTLPALIDRFQIERIDFLKMDCEGVEGLVLLSTPPTYLSRIRQMAMEFHNQMSPVPLVDIRRYLEQAGFQTRKQPSNEAAYSYLFAWR